MGNPIVYCSGCRKQLRQAQFDEGAAYHVQDQICCAKCARKNVRRLPESLRRTILARAETSGKGTKTSRIMHALVLNRSSVHYRAGDRATSRLMGYLLGAAGLFLMLAVLIASASASGTRPRGVRPGLPATNQQR